VRVRVAVYAMLGQKPYVGVGDSWVCLCVLGGQRGGGATWHAHAYSHACQRGVWGPCMHTSNTRDEPALDWPSGVRGV
jgi:hypothetical protein